MRWRVLQDVGAELDRAIAKFPPFHNPHEGYAVIREELDELWDDIKANNRDNLRLEAVQVAAMAVRFVLMLDGEGEQ